MLEILNAVVDGHCYSDLTYKYPGHMSHSTWLRTANRILRLYVSTEDPDENLMTQANFVVKVYGPMWFQIKMNPSCTNGTKHVMNTTERSQYLSPDLKKIVHSVIQRNAYFANLILGMLSDERRVIREFAHRRILKFFHSIICHFTIEL